MDKNNINATKITLEEYQKNNTNSDYIKAAKSYLLIVEQVVGLIVIAVLFFLVLRLFEIHEIAGYVGIALSIIVFILFYIVPIIKIHRTKSFMTNVDNTNVRQAQKFNKMLREELADKIIDAVTKVGDVKWYSDENVEKLSVARRTKNDTELKNVLTKIYTTDIKKNANNMIGKCALSVGDVTAMSQSELIDTSVILIFEMKLIKDLVYLYGYRPTDPQMIKIMQTVFYNSLLTYGVSISFSSVANFISNATNSLPIIGTLIGSVAQGIVNSTFVVIIGNQTKKYLVKEFHLQNVLDNVELMDTVEEQEKLVKSVAEEVKKNTSKRKPMKPSVASSND